MVSHGASCWLLQLRLRLRCVGGCSCMPLRQTATQRGRFWGVPGVHPGRQQAPPGLAPHACRKAEFFRWPRLFAPCQAVAKGGCWCPWWPPKHSRRWVMPRQHQRLEARSRARARAARHNSSVCGIKGLLRGSGHACAKRQGAGRAAGVRDSGFFALGLAFLRDAGRYTGGGCSSTALNCAAAQPG
jgi:hypothetical protein